MIDVDYYIDNGKWLGEMSELVDRLRVDHKVPDELIEGFIKAVAKRSKNSRQERIAAALPLTNHLLKCIEKVNEAEKDPDTSPSVKALMPRSVITRTTWELLNMLTDDFEEMPSLKLLVSDLFDIKDYSKKSGRMRAAEKAAMTIMATNPDVSARTIAKTLNVSPSTVTRWKNKDEAFNVNLKRMKKEIQNDSSREEFYLTWLVYFLTDNWDELEDVLKP
ncbi:MAG: hypothetical protein HN578_20960 [Rhodospirillales bacterium]|jgi:hypothetical protein|nr:hypothetical protein [Rhodospirillales bacterium]